MLLRIHLHQRGEILKVGDTVFLIQIEIKVPNLKKKNVCRSQQVYPANDLFSLFKSMAFYSKRNVSSLSLPLSNSFSNRYLRSDGGLPVNVNVLVICLLCSGDPLILQEME